MDRDQESHLPVHDGMVGAGVKFQRIRRITGYLVGTLARFNNAKRAEESQRVRHGTERDMDVGVVRGWLRRTTSA